MPREEYPSALALKSQLLSLATTLSELSSCAVAKLVHASLIVLVAITMSRHRNVRKLDYSDREGNGGVHECLPHGSWIHIVFQLSLKFYRLLIMAVD